jgi:hypothetical protein
MKSGRKPLNRCALTGLLVVSALASCITALASNQDGIDLGYPPAWHGAVEIGPPADENAWWPSMCVNAYSGNLNLQFPCLHYESEYGLDLDFVLSFNGKPPEIDTGWMNGGNLPAGWTHSYYMYLIWYTGNDKVKVRMGDGKVVQYDEGDNYSLTGEEGWYGRLSYDDSGDEFTLTMPDQVKYVFERYSGPIGNYRYYRLKKLTDPTSGWDKWVTVTWNDTSATSRIQTVQEASGLRKLVFTYSDKSYGMLTYKRLVQIELETTDVQGHQADVRLEYPESGSYFELTGVRNKEEEDKQEYPDDSFLTQFTYSTKGSRRVPTTITDP